MMPFHCFGEKRVFISRGAMEQRPHFEWNKDNIGEQGHKKHFLYILDRGGGGKLICISGTLEQVPLWDGLYNTNIKYGGFSGDIRDWYKCGLKETGLSLYMFRKWRANHARIMLRSFDRAGGGGGES